MNKSTTTLVALLVAIIAALSVQLWLDNRPEPQPIKTKYPPMKAAVENYRV